MTRIARIRSFAPLALVIALLALGLSACGSPPDPIVEIRRQMKDIPNWSIILDDMREQGNFFKTYEHQYKIITPENTTTTPWREVPKAFFEKNLPFLGMTIYAVVDGVATAEAQPPGYQYVGDDRYGRWERDSSGNSFWAFYGQYALFSHLLGGRNVYRSDWDTYNTYRSQGRPYYGPNTEYGTNGSYTKKAKPNFYTRRMSTMRSTQSSFSDRVNQRTGRTSSSVRGRSGGTGK